jgi:hypothetical protein
MTVRLRAVGPSFGDNAAVPPPDAGHRLDLDQQPAAVSEILPGRALPRHARRPSTAIGRHRAPAGRPVPGLTEVRVTPASGNDAGATGLTKRSPGRSS